MDIEQIVAQAVAPFVETVGDAVDASVAALAALEAAGYAIYRPDECEGVTVEVMNVARGTGPIDGFYAAGTYRLVPVGGDS